MPAHPRQGGPGEPAELPLQPNDTGDAVRDLQHRLGRAGHDVTACVVGVFDEATQDAVRAFQSERGLLVDGRCNAATWQTLVEAGYRLGDRLLYLRAPMLRGDDVAALQRHLGALGFDAGRIDGIFGPDTERALREFQRNTGLTTDGVCGRDVLAALGRLGDRPERADAVASVREMERLRSAPRTLTDRRIAVAHDGSLDALAGAVARHLHERGARVVVLTHPDESAQAQQANQFGADVYLEVTLREPSGRAAFYSTTGFTSIGGQRLATLIISAFTNAPVTLDHVAGLRLPVLRETKMPAVVCFLGPPASVVEHLARTAECLVDGLAAWVETPFDQCD